MKTVPVFIWKSYNLRFYPWVCCPPWINYGEMCASALGDSPTFGQLLQHFLWKDYPPCTSLGAFVPSADWACGPTSITGLSLNEFSRGKHMTQERLSSFRSSAFHMHFKISLTFVSIFLSARIMTQIALNRLTSLGNWPFNIESSDS